MLRTRKSGRALGGRDDALPALNGRHAMIEVSRRLQYQDSRGFCNCYDRHLPCKTSHHCEKCNQQYFCREVENVEHKYRLICKRNPYNGMLDVQPQNGLARKSQYPQGIQHAAYEATFYKTVCVGLRDPNETCWERKV